MIEVLSAVVPGVNNENYFLISMLSKVRWGFSCNFFLSDLEVNYFLNKWLFILNCCNFSYCDK